MGAIILGMPSPWKGPRKGFLLRMPVRTWDRISDRSERDGLTMTDTILTFVAAGLDEGASTGGQAGRQPGTGGQ